ncbi:MAG: aminodeoxychorismate synthase component I [Armatimonadota bacterium]
MPLPGDIVLQQTDTAGKTGWWSFRNPVEIVSTSVLADIPRCLRRIEQAVEAGQYAAGFLTYEAGPAFDAALSAHPSGALPLLWFGIYADADPYILPPSSLSAPFDLAWSPSVTYAEYQQALTRIKDYIAAGDTYQVNYTWRLRSPFADDPWTFFLAMSRAQRSHYCAYVDIGDHVLCSASPELFFHLSGNTVTCRPMKGTASRGLTWREDQAHVKWLAHSEKNRAENLMIVDMIRNDLGRVAEVGSVQVPRLFDIERYHTVLQMTSTVTASTPASLGELFAALFPCASITGAPKVRTSHIITELETAPRGIYTGCIGFAGPARTAQFNVAIRTVHIDRTRQQAEYGTGGGIVWDSDVRQEYEECRTKALVLLAHDPPFSLLETLLWQPYQGYFLLAHHLQRLSASVNYFGYPVDINQVAERLLTAATYFTQPQRVRLLADETGEITIESSPFERPTIRRNWRVALAAEPVDRMDRFLYHKTTRRGIYQHAREAFPHHDDVILWNARGEVTESTVANLVVKRNGALITPPVSSGLLAGVYREFLLARGCLREEIVTREDLREADAVYLINSVRRWIPVEVTP